MCNSYSFLANSFTLDYFFIKIIWIFTQSQRVLIATSANNWQWYDWSETLPLIDGATFSIADYLKAERL